MTTETRSEAPPDPHAAGVLAGAQPQARTQLAEIAQETGQQPAVAEQQPEEAGAPKARVDARGLLSMLQETSPIFREIKPLALRIDKAIAARFPEVDRKVIRTAMRLHTTSTRYLKVMEKAVARFDLDGKENGEVTEEQRAHAKQTLKERFAESARRKKAALDAEKARRDAEEAERRKAAKLQQLLGKFSKG